MGDARRFTCPICGEQVSMERLGPNFDTMTVEVGSARGWAVLAGDDVLHQCGDIDLPAVFQKLREHRDGSL
jgi:hypothetical protein